MFGCEIVANKDVEDFGLNPARIFVCLSWFGHIVRFSTSAVHVDFFTAKRKKLNFGLSLFE